MTQKIYLSNVELHDAIDKLFKRIEKNEISSEMIEAENSLGRITAKPIYALINSPHYNASAMDGIAAISKNTLGANDKNHIELIEGVDYIVVDTGDPIPKAFDCVIMVEDLVRAGDGRVSIYKSAIPWQNIRPIGEDIIEGQLIIPSGHCIRPVDIGSMLAAGVNHIPIYKKPVIGIIPTGTELVEPNTELKIGNIIDFNSRVFSAQITQWGGIPKRYSIVKDVYEDIKELVLDAIKTCDIVLINAGSSAGREDYTAQIIGELGVVLVHGVAIKPGKPVILGCIEEKPVIGIPGYPVSAFFIMQEIVKRLLYKYQSQEIMADDMVTATLSRRIVSSLKHLEFIRVKLGYVDEKLIATPLNRGAGATMSLVRADGILKIPQNIEGIEAGSKVQIKLVKNEDEIRNTIVCIGSHDPIIDVLMDLLHSDTKIYSIASSHVGSMGGIMALKSGETHIAPIHLLDMTTGEYNVSYLKKYIPDRELCIIKCVKRIQGLIVQKGNPKNIKSLEDVLLNNLTFVNRQRGSGTRYLLDYNLNKLNINSSAIEGYEREEYTHLGVAVAVKSGDADCGLGVCSAANIMGLDFISLCSEEYDFAIPKDFLKLDSIKKLIEVMKSKKFIDELDKLGGYDHKGIGEIIFL